MIRLFTLLISLTLALCSGAQTGRFYTSDKLSSSIIQRICQDKLGYIWVATDYGLNRFDGYRFRVYLNRPDDPKSLCYNSMSSLFCDRDGNMWIGTAKGLDRYDYAGDCFEHYDFPDNVKPRVSCVIQLRNGRILIGTAGYGLYAINKDTQKVEIVSGYAPEGHNSYFSRLYEDSNGILWKSSYENNVTFKNLKKKTPARVLKTTLGYPLAFLESRGEMFVVCTYGIHVVRNGRLETADFDLSLLHGEELLIQTAYKDSKDNIYIGTRGKGLYRIATGSRRLEAVGDVLGAIDMRSSRISAIAEDREKNLWVGCRQKGLVMLSNHKEQFCTWSFSAQKMSMGTAVSSICLGDNDIVWCTVQSNGVYGFDTNGKVVAHPDAPLSVECLFRDRSGAYWLGTDGDLYIYNPLSGAYSHKATFDCEKINDMTDCGDGNIYISAFSKGLWVYDKATGKFRNYSFMMNDSKNGKLCNDWIMAMMPDSHGLLWIATASGVSCFNPRTGSFRPLGWDVLLSDMACYSLCETNDGRILMGTECGLYVYDRKTKKTLRFPDSEQLSNKIVTYIVQDNNGDIWCSTSMGIWQWQKRHKRFVGHINGNGLKVKEYIIGVGLHTDKDRIYFGINDGITHFNPNSLYTHTPTVGEVKLTGFLIGGKPVNANTVSNGVRVTEQCISSSDHFTVSYLDNSFQMEFSMLCYDNPENILLEYRINGSNGWVGNTEGSSVITLNHLQPGTYRLEVRAFENGVYSPVRTFSIIVTAPWFRTTWAYLVYIILFIALVAYILYTYSRKKREQLDEEKMKFLINATHDIRSPLTLVMSPLSKLRKRNLGTDNERELDIIERNVKRIQNLVNSILDVRKIDKQQMKLNCQETDLVAFTSGILKLYEYNAGERNIGFLFTHFDEKLMVWIDRVNFDKVITNLLSNAFKYSYDNGSIEVRLRIGHDGSGMMKDYAEMQVIDSGVGLDEDSRNKIFDRFYQGANSPKANVDGTGIGLNLCKMIVDLHHGTIAADNRTDGQGSVFTVRLPLGNRHFTPEELNVADDTALYKCKKPARTNYRILVVDDDEEIGNYISGELGEYYKFGICHNGKEGLKELLSKPYDLVISDVMMPEMDGFTMLRMIKTNSNISHIPVIMLTSKADVANRLSCLEKGGDAFLPKPFNMDELHACIDNLINNVLRLKGKFSGAQQQKVENREVKGNNEALMERIVKSVNKNLGNSDFNVDMLADEVGVSRAQLHRKMKEMTGIPASEFIRNIRLEQAARLLKEQKINVTQVAYAVGFSNLAHFSTVFRKHFGMAPSEYVERNC